MAERTKKYAAPSSGESLRQGEIVANLIQTRLDPGCIGSHKASIQQIIHPFAIVLSQDCDLEQTFKKMNESAPVQKWTLPNILFCEVTLAVETKAAIGAPNLWERSRSNRDERYHCLEQISKDDDAEHEGFGPLGVDFKRYFTVPFEEVFIRIKSGELKRRSRLVANYARHFASRFFNYQSRVALEEPHKISGSGRAALAEPELAD